MAAVRPTWKSASNWAAAGVTMEELMVLGRGGFDQYVWFAWVDEGGAGSL